MLNYINNYEDIFTILESNDIKELSVSESFELAVYTHGLLEIDKNKGEKIVINILNYWSKIPLNTYELWTDIIEIAGFYPYLEKEKNKLKFNNLFGEIRKGHHLSSNLDNKFFHEEQLKALHILEEGKNLILSAPTSFGKSLLIEEIVASNKYKNIVVIQPTLALLDETRQKLNKYSENYKLLIRTTQKPSDVKGNIFLFTAERVNEYQCFSSVNFLVIDEFYKLSGQRDDERSSFLNNAFYNLYNRFQPQFYLLGPNIDGISEGFSEKYNAEFYRTNYSLVDNRVVDIYVDHEDGFNSAGKKAYKNKVLFELLQSLDDEQTIVYCSSPSRVKSLSKEFTDFLVDKKVPKTSKDLTLIEWIQKNISPEWGVIDSLLHNIGIHDGSLPKHMTSTIIDYFNTGKLKYIFCTSTIIEGVNTSAKNIIYFDQKKGGADVDFFDYANIRGRAGRMMEHYIGNIYNFNSPPQKEGTYIVDIPFHQQDPIKDETLIQLESVDVINKESEQYTFLMAIPDKELALIKRNGINVKGQIKVLKILRRDFEKNKDLISWCQYPKYEQLKYILGLAWDNFIVSSETQRPMNKEWLVQMIFNYGLKKDINTLITERYEHKKKVANENNRCREKEGKKIKEVNEKKLLNESIQTTMQMIKHWGQYKVPKWLSVMSALQELVCDEHSILAGDYLYYANSLENDFLPENLTILLEYGVPVSAIRKISSKISNELTQDNVITFVKEQKLYKDAKLLRYEREKLEKVL